MGGPKSKVPTLRKTAKVATKGKKSKMSVRSRVTTQVKYWKQEKLTKKQKALAMDWFFEQINNKGWDFPMAYKRCRRCLRTITKEELDSRHHCRNHKA